MPVTRTHTKTYVLLDPWASTIPWDCLVRDTRCCHPTHDHDPMVGDPCAVEDCRKSLLADETCYAVVQYRRISGPLPQNPAGRVRDREQRVCWRHVRPDDGPIKV
jgi:hypothetical protein